MGMSALCSCQLRCRLPAGLASTRLALPSWAQPCPALGLRGRGDRPCKHTQGKS